MQKLSINQTNYVHPPTTVAATNLKLVRLEGGACVMTEVGEGMVGWRPSKPKCSGREPGRTMVGVGAEILGGVSCDNINHSSQSKKDFWLRTKDLLIFIHRLEMKARSGKNHHSHQII